MFGVVQGQTAQINVTVLANPRPRIEWLVNGNSVNEGSQSGRYHALEPVDLGHGQYNVTLSIAELTIEDTAMEYTLKVSNNIGDEVYSVLISSSEATTPSDVGIVVGSSLAAAALLVLLIVVLVTYLKKKLCFSGKNNVLLF